MKKKVGEILVEKGWATPDQIEKALAYGKAENCRIGEALLNLELCSQEQITRALAIHNQLPFANLGKHVIAQDIIDLVPKEVAIENQIIPVAKKGERRPVYTV